MSFFATLVGFGMLVAGISSLVVWFNDLRGTGTGGGMLFIGVICVIIAAVLRVCRDYFPARARSSHTELKSIAE